ncbi:MAG: HAMP domain-containing histidine kinase [Candidatus Melainabacteria bacterium]|nr:HAMP domain-containing histidine kinase [Candidatus Melainabacteria bacterium]
MEIPPDVMCVDFAPPANSRPLYQTVSAELNLAEQRNDFVSMVMHDLRAPLANLRMFLELTQAGLYGQTEQRFDAKIGQLLAELARMNRMLDDVLDYECIEQGHMVLKKVSVNTEELVNAAINAVEHNAAMKQIRFVRTCTKFKIDVDSDRIVQVLINLLQNAIKFSPEKGTIRISVTERNNVVRFSVIDEGIGIKLSDRAHIFSRFGQAETAEKKNGFGLGLAVSDAIVKQHGGKIGVIPNETGTGSHFWFELPAPAQRLH